MVGTSERTPGARECDGGGRHNLVRRLRPSVFQYAKLLHGVAPAKPFPPGLPRTGAASLPLLISKFERTLPRAVLRTTKFSCPTKIPMPRRFAYNGCPRRDSGVP